MVYLGESTQILGMARETGSPKLLFENLDLTPIYSILWTDLHTEGLGRPVVYQPEWDLRVLMLRQLLQIPYMKGSGKAVQEEPLPPPCLRIR